MFNHRHRDYEARLGELSDRIEAVRSDFRDLLTLLRASNALPKDYQYQAVYIENPDALGTVKDTGSFSTAEPSVCGCPVSWTGSAALGGAGRAVWHFAGCPLTRRTPAAPTISALEEHE